MKGNQKMIKKNTQGRKGRRRKDGGRKGKKRGPISRVLVGVGEVAPWLTVHAAHVRQRTSTCLCMWEQEHTHTHMNICTKTGNLFSKGHPYHSAVCHLICFSLDLKIAK